MIEQNRKERIWTKSFIIILTLNLIATTSTFIVMATFPLYIQSVGGNRFMAGLVTGAFTFSSFFARPFFGNLVDHKGRKAILYLGNMIVLAVVFGYSFFPYIAVLFSLRIIQGIGFSAVSTASSTIVSDLVPPTRRFEGIGFYGISSTLAMAIGPALGLYIVEHYNYSILYILTGLIVCLVFGLTLLLFHYTQQYKVNNADRTAERIDNPAITQKTNYRPVIFEKTAIIPSLVFFFIAITSSSIVTFFPSYALSLGVKNVGLFFVFYSGSMLITRPTTGRIADRVGPTKVLLPGMLFLIIAFLLLAKVSSLSSFLFAGIFYGLGLGSVQPVLNSLVIALAPAERRGAANATFLAANDIGLGTGAILWGIISQHLGFIYLYQLSPLLIITSLVLYLIFLRPKMFTRL